jgi:CheY-like chemotaxis protein
LKDSTAAKAMGRSFEGTGIGLSLVKELISLHGGAISLTSVEGKGSIFTVKIPFGRTHLKEETIRKNDLFENELVRQSFIEHGNSLLLQDVSDTIVPVENLPSVLVVDDNADMRQYLVKLLKTKYNVITAVNGLDALHQVQKTKPAIIISDIMMPIMNGFEMMKELRSQENSRSIPIIILSARAGEEATVEGVDAGADDYLIKPFSAKELLARVASHIQIGDMRKKAKQIMEVERKRLYDLFMQAPAAIAVLRGPNLIFEIANPLYLEVARKKNDILGKPILKALPEFKGQPIEKILFDVFKTGKAYVGKEVLVKLFKPDSKITEDTYFNFVYQPFIIENDVVDGVIIHAVEVTYQVQNKKHLT